MIDIHVNGVAVDKVNNMDITMTTNIKRSNKQPTYQSILDHIHYSIDKY